MEISIFKVYVKIDEENHITLINSSAFLTDTTGHIEIDEGEGDKYAHAQGNYLDNPIMDMQGRYNYKLVDGVIVEIPEKEKPEFKPYEPHPSETSVWDELDKSYREGVDSV